MSSKNDDSIKLTDIVNDEDAPDTLGDITGEAIRQVDWFVIIIMAIVFLLVNSDVFINTVLINWPDAVSQGETTATGTILQMLTQIFLVLGAIFVKKIM